MAISQSNIGNALFTRTQQRVLGLLFGRPQQSFYLNEIVRLAGIGKGTVKRELERLTEVGLITLEQQGNQTHYQANPDSPIFSELSGIVLKTFGVADVIKQALGSLLDSIDLALIYGSVAKGLEHAGSDIDLLLVGEGLIYSEIMQALLPAEQQLGRTINPTVYSSNEFEKRRKDKHHFIDKITTQPTLRIKGELNESIGELG